MSKRKCSLRNDMSFIKMCIALSLWKRLCVDGTSDTSTQQVIVNIGSNVTLNCTMDNSFQYPIRWIRGSAAYIGVKEQSGPSYIYDAFKNQSYSLTYEELYGIFSLTISGANPDDAGQYKCVGKKL